MQEQGPDREANPLSVLKSQTHFGFADLQQYVRGSIPDSLNAADAKDFILTTLAEVSGVKPDIAKVNIDSHTLALSLSSALLGTTKISAQTHQEVETWLRKAA